jgi:hypothetical protein
LDKDNKLVKDTAIFNVYQKGFGNLKQKIKIYKDSLLKLKGYVIDYGLNDGYSWIPEGSKYYDSLLTANGIPHRLMVNKGGHGDLIVDRTENYQLPFCDSLLTYDTLHLNNQAIVEKYTCSGQLSEAVIDTVDKEISVMLKPTVSTKRLIAYLYVSPGARIKPFINSIAYADYSNPTIKYSIISENGKDSSEWTLNVGIGTAVNSPVKKQGNCEIYPNPVSGALNVKSNLSEELSVQISDITGKSILSQTLQSSLASVDVRNFPQGIYIIKFVGTSTNETMKFIVK